MLYSQLYRSILRACRELSRRPHYTSRLVISLPLLISVPSAYGAIVSPQVETASSIDSMKPVNTASSTIDNKTVEDIATLKDASRITYKKVATVPTSQSKSAPVDGADVDLSLIHI